MDLMFLGLKLNEYQRTGFENGLKMSPYKQVTFYYDKKNDFEPKQRIPEVKSLFFSTLVSSQSIIVITFPG